MKITFIEEIEARKAWHESMACPQCAELKYNIHHQLKPETPNTWWIECLNCGFEVAPSPSRKIAILRWKKYNKQGV